jgi:hypothetical protein
LRKFWRWFHSVGRSQIKISVVLVGSWRVELLRSLPGFEPGEGEFMAEVARYVYSAVRVVPNPATGEFANMAAIAGSDETGEWSIRSLQNERRIRGFCGADALLAAHDFLTRLGMSVDLDERLLDEEGLVSFEDFAGRRDGPLMRERWLQELADRNRHTVQLSNPAPVLASSAEDALDSIFEHLVVEPEPRRKSLTKHRLLSNLNFQYLKAGLEAEQQFSYGAQLSSSGPKDYRHTIDYIVGEESAVQIVQAWSFQVAGQAMLSRDVKAWGWTMRELLEHGGNAITKTRRVPVPRDVEIEVVLAEPVADEPVDAYREALSVCADLSVPVHPHGDERSVAAEAVRLLNA